MVVEVQDSKNSNNVFVFAGKNKDMAKTIINNVYNVKAVVANMGEGEGNVEINDIITNK